MQQVFRWGILGTGNIAHQFARGLQSVPDGRLVAVGSRSQATADKFGEEFGVERRHPTYEALAADPDVDAIYISTPHSLHRENTLLCLESGKAVLCEKPFAINAREAAEMIRVARERRVFLMEAMWTRFMPALVRTREIIAAGTIGEVRMVAADFGFRARFNPESRLFDPSLGGGALLDVGIYPVSLASMLFGTPDRIAGLAELGETGVDEQGVMILGYKGGPLAVLYTAITTTTPHDAVIMGTQGSIRINAPWWYPKALTLTLSGKEPEILDLPYEGNGYNYEAVEVMSCVRAGKLESEIVPLDETLSIMETLDRIRAQWGLRYPMD